MASTRGRISRLFPVLQIRLYNGGPITMIGPPIKRTTSPGRGKTFIGFDITGFRLCHNVFHIDGPAKTLTFESFFITNGSGGE